MARGARGRGAGGSAEGGGGVTVSDPRSDREGRFNLGPWLFFYEEDVPQTQQIGRLRLKSRKAGARRAASASGDAKRAGAF